MQNRTSNLAAFNLFFPTSIHVCPVAVTDLETHEEVVEDHYHFGSPISSINVALIGFLTSFGPTKLMPIGL